MLPTAIACNAVATKTANVVTAVTARIASCAANVSGITSGSGPSSRIEPASTYGTPRVTSACMIPLFAMPPRTAASIDPARRTALIARICSAWPPSTPSPELDIPSVVPKMAASRSCTATALPPRSALQYPFSMNQIMSSRARACTSAGPITHRILPPRCFSSPSSCASTL